MTEPAAVPKMVDSAFPPMACPVRAPMPPPISMPFRVRESAKAFVERMKKSDVVSRKIFLRFISPPFVMKMNNEHQVRQYKGRRYSGREYCIADTGGHRADIIGKTIRYN
jgi:hypothetical protein